MLTGDVIAYVLLLAPGWKSIVLEPGPRDVMRLRWRNVVIITSAYVFWLAAWFAVMGTALSSFKSP
jgi:hypothetical protein